MKRMLFLLLLPIIGLMSVACDDDDDEKKGGDESATTNSLVLTADRPYITANGSDKVTFTVKDAAGEDVSLKCVYKANEEELVDNTLTTTTPGTYKVSATYKGVTSNMLDVVALGENVKLKVVADKKSIIADGGDFACLYLEDEQGSRLPDGEFYVNGEKLNTPYFETDKPGSYRISAIWKGKEAEDALTLGAFADGEYTPRMLVESWTGTMCQYCTPVIKVLTEGDAVARKEPRVILIETHHGGAMKYDARSNDMDNCFGQYYKATGTPSVYFDREKTKFNASNLSKEVLLSSIKNKADVAIAIKTSFSEDRKSINVDAVVGSKKSFKGKIIAALVEDGLYLYHVELGMIEWYHTMRDYRPSFEGGDAVSIEPKSLTKAQFNIPLGLAKAEQSRIVVFVTNEAGTVENIQEVVAGNSIGY